MLESETEQTLHPLTWHEGTSTRIGGAKRATLTGDGAIDDGPVGEHIE